MNKSEQDQWKSELLDQIIVAFGHSNDLAECLIFKGARILAKLLPGATRQSLDLDSNLTQAFVEAHPDRSEQATFLQSRIEVALRRHFERGSPVRYELAKVSVRPYPPRGHKRGWDAFKVRLTVRDRLHPNTLALPAPTIDIAAPERLSEGSVERLELDGGGAVSRYSLVRQTGEKLRAFLTSLPAYRSKIGGSRGIGAVRAKDLYDLARVARQHPIEDASPFWVAVGEEFRNACESRFVDCAGISAFRERWTETQATYEASGLFERDVPFTEVEQVLEALCTHFVKLGLLPFEYPLPED